MSFAGFVTLSLEPERCTTPAVEPGVECVRAEVRGRAGSGSLKSGRVVLYNSWNSRPLRITFRCFEHAAVVAEGCRMRKPVSGQLLPL